MKEKLLGIHHVTAIAGDAVQNHQFYSNILGLRFIKKTVNFDDPHTYHFYFGDEMGSAGTILTFFPWGKGIPQGRRGTGMATEIGYSAPPGSLQKWVKRFEENGVIYNKPSVKFGERYLSFLDPDGLKLELIESKNPDYREPWTTKSVNSNIATRGFHNITLSLADISGTAGLLTDVFGYELSEQEANRYRFITQSIENAAIVDLVELPHEKRGHVANGTVHHVAFRVQNDEVLNHYRKTLFDSGFNVTDVIDRQYFHSIYFREPGGVLFEIATDNPGFTVDEAPTELGTALKLPPQHEILREELESELTPINID